MSHEQTAIAHCRSNSAKQLQRAISTMRQACDDAEHRANHGGDPIDLAAQVMHAFAWGLANASSHIETALSYAKDAAAIAADSATTEEQQP